MINCPNEFKNKIVLPIFQLFVMALGIFLFSALIAILIFKTFLKMNSLPEWSHLIYWGIFSIVFFFVVKEIGINPQASLKNWWKNKKTHFKLALKYFLTFSGFLILLGGGLIILGVLFEKLVGYSVSTGKSFDFLRVSGALKSKPEIIFLIFSTCIFAPIIEEVFFRRFFFVALRKKMNFFPSLLTSSFVFGITHGGNVIMATVYGLYLGYVYEKEKSLPANIILHAMLNVTTISLIIFISKSF